MASVSPTPSQSPGKAEPVSVAFVRASRKMALGCLVAGIMQFFHSRT